MAFWKISGDPRSVGCTAALVGDLVEDKTTGTTYIRTGSGTLDFTPAATAFTTGAIATGTVNTIEEADGSPSYTSSITTLRFDQADGFVLTNPVAGVVRVDLTGIPEANVTNLVSDLAGKASTTHATAHKDGGSDELSTATPGANVIPKAGSGGNLAIGFLATGTPDGTKFVRDDGTLQTPSSGAPTNASYLTLNSNATLSAERVLTGSTAISLTDGGVNTTLTLDLNTGGVATANLAAGAVTLAKMANISSAQVIGRSTAGTGVPESLSIAAPLTSSGAALGFDQTATLGNNARVAVSKGGSAIGTRRGLNLIEGTNITLSVADNSGSERVDVTITSSSGASVGGINTGITASATTTLGATKTYGSLHRIDTVSATIDYISTTGWSTGTAFILYNNSNFTLNIAHNSGGVPGGTAAIFGPGGSSASIGAKYAYWVMYDGTYFRVTGQ